MYTGIFYLYYTIVRIFSSLLFSIVPHGVYLPSAVVFTKVQYSLGLFQNAFQTWTFHLFFYIIHNTSGTCTTSRELLFQKIIPKTLMH